MAIMLNQTKRSRGQAAAYAGLLTLLQALPWLVLLAGGVSLLAVANESIAYRYFHSFRLVQGEVGTIWEAQGQTLGVFHVLLQHGLDALGVENLRQRIDFFSYATLAANSLAVGLISYRLARSAEINRVGLGLFAAVAVFGVYGSGWGLASARLPDYYTLEVTLTLACLALFLKATTAPGLPGPRRLAMLGALAGMMVGIKITLLTAAALPLIPFLFTREGSPTRAIRMLTIWGLATGGTLLFILYAYYHFDHAHLTRALVAWRSFVAAPGAEPGFVQSILNPFKPPANPWVDHRFVWAVGGLWLGAIAVFAFDRRRAPVSMRASLAFLGVALLGASLLHVVTVVRRPAETTLFESALFLSTTGAAYLFAAPAPGAHRRRLALGWALLLVAWSGVSASRHFPSPATIAAAGDASRKAWEIHEWINRTGLPAIILLPDNNSTSGSVEEALLKGFSDVPTWEISTGYEGMERVAPGRTFVRSLGQAFSHHVVMWTDIPGRAPLAETDEVLAGMLAMPGASPAQSWEIRRGPAWVRTVHVAITGAGDDVSSLPVLVGSHRWAESTAENPLAGFTISPAQSAPRIERLTEEGRTFVRVVATRASDYLAVTGLLPQLPDGAGPLKVSARVRSNRPRTIVTQIYDIAGADGTAAVSASRVAVPARVWTHQQVAAPKVTFKHPSDNFSVGMTEVVPGDVLDIELIELRDGQIRR